jgi:class 3 adenylate cyclase
MKSTADMSFDELIEYASVDPTVSQEVERRFESIVAILVVDFSSMRARMDAFGVVSTLVTVRGAMRVYEPAVLDAGGVCTKTVADTLFAVFPDAVSALNAALDGHGRMVVHNQSRPGNIANGAPNAPIHPKTGLGFGPSLVIPGENLFGPQVNRAFILGEDIARKGEILASSAFAAAIGVPPAGVGVHAAPHDREHASGFPFHIYTDYRDESDLGCKPKL